MPEHRHKQTITSASDIAWKVFTVAGGRNGLDGLRSGDGLLSARARPSCIKHDCDRRATNTGGKCLVNVHAKSRLILEICLPEGQPYLRALSAHGTSALERFL